VSAQGSVCGRRYHVLISCPVDLRVHVDLLFSQLCGGDFI